MGEREFDKLLYKAAPSRIISLHLYLLTAILAGLSASMSLDILSLGLPIVAGADLNVMLPLSLGVLSLIVFFYAELKRLTRRYMVYENRVARREGILSKRIQYMPYNKVERVELNQSIVKRLFGIGDVVIDTGEDSIVLEAIRNPARVESMLAERLSFLQSSGPSS
ncbi:MAG: PH domain-containing protein [Thermoplasmata archaeon]